MKAKSPEHAPEETRTKRHLSEIAFTSKIYYNIDEVKITERNFALPAAWLIFTIEVSQNALIVLHIPLEKFQTKSQK